MSDDPQKAWNEYYDRIKNRRLKAAELLWDDVEAAGADAETWFSLDFTHFGNDRAGAEGLAHQLSENYAVELSAAESGYWFVKGTTRPEGVSLTREQHNTWVEFMADVAQSYACVFSGWMLEAPRLQRKFQSAHLDD